MNEIQQRLYHAYLMLDTAQGILAGEDLPPVGQVATPGSLRPLHDKLSEAINLLFDIRREIDSSRPLRFTPRLVDPEGS